MNRWLATAALAGGWMTAGCAMLNRTQVSYTRTTTVGQELLDLQQAREKGAISEAEYNKVRKALLEGGPVMVGAPVKP